MGWAYLAAALPLCACAVRALARGAREPEARLAWRWYLLGVVLGGFGIDSTLVIHRLTSAHPSPLAALPLVLVGATLVYVLIREWQRLAQVLPGTRATALAAQRAAELEALATEAADSNPESAPQNQSAESSRAPQT